MAVVVVVVGRSGAPCVSSLPCYGRAGLPFSSPQRTKLICLWNHPVLALCDGIDAGKRRHVNSRASVALCAGASLSAAGVIGGVGGEWRWWCLEWSWLVYQQRLNELLLLVVWARAAFHSGL